MTATAEGPLAAPASRSSIHGFAYLLRQAGWAGACEVIGLVLRYVLILTIVRLFGVVGLGLYALLMAIGDIAGIIGRAGFDEVVLRYLPHHLARGKPGLARGVALFSSGIGLAQSLAIAALLVIAAPYIAEFWHEPELARGTRLVAVTLPFIAVNSIWLAALRGFRDVRFPVTLEKIVLPVLMLFSMPLIKWLRAEDPLGALIGTLVAYPIVSVAAGGMLWRKLRQLEAPSAYETKLWFLFGLSMSLNSGLLLVAFRVDTLMIGWLLTASDVGVYTGAMRFAWLVLLPSFAMSSIFTPTVSHMYARGDSSTLQYLYARLTWGTLALSSLIGLAMCAGGRWALGLLGPEFVAAYWTAVILVWAHVLNAGTSPSSFVIAMTGRTGWRVMNSCLSMALNVVLNWMLIPRWGIAGAAAATAISLTFVNILRVLQVKFAVGLSLSLQPSRPL